MRQNRIRTSAAAGWLLGAALSTAALAGDGCDPQWQVFPSGFDRPVYSFGVVNGELYVGGSFEDAHGQTCRAIARWELTEFDNLAAGLVYNFGSQRCNAIAPLGGALVAGGSFVRAGSVDVSNLAVWTPNTWAALGDSEYFSYGSVRTLLVVEENGADVLYAGTTYGGLHRWDGVWAPEGLTGLVSALAIYDDGSGPALYAARTSAGVSSIERRDPISGAWTPIASLDAIALDLQVWNDGAGSALFACGEFTSIDGAEARRIARWDGAAWTPLATGFDNPANAMTVWDDGAGERLWIGGEFALAGGQSAQRLASWDGAAFAGVGATIAGVIEALQPFDDGSGNALWIGGNVFSVNGQTTQKIARYFGCPVPAACPGDTNGDNVIDFQDLNAVISAFNTVAADPNYNPAADIDADGDVDFADLNVVLSAFNTDC